MVFTLLFSLLAFSFGCLEGEKILEERDTITMILYNRFREVL